MAKLMELFHAERTESRADDQLTIGTTDGGRSNDATGSTEPTEEPTTPRISSDADDGQVAVTNAGAPVRVSMGELASLAERSTWPELIVRVEQLGCKIVSGPGKYGSFWATMPCGKPFLIYTQSCAADNRMIFNMRHTPLTFAELAERIKKSSPVGQVSRPANPQPTKPVETFRTASKTSLFG